MSLPLTDMVDEGTEMGMMALFAFYTREGRFTTDFSVPYESLHRDYGPALLFYNPLANRNTQHFGNISNTYTKGWTWYQDGKAHRIGAPASYRATKGVRAEFSWFIRGINVTTNIEFWLEHNYIDW